MELAWPLKQIGTNLFSLDYVGRDVGIEEAKASGLDIIIPKPNELQIDIDSDEAMTGFYERWEMFLRMIPASTKRIAPSKSGYPRAHITITLPFDIEDLERVLFQSLLGSDYRREMLNTSRVLMGDPDPIVFFERKV